MNIELETYIKLNDYEGRHTLEEVKKMPPVINPDSIADNLHYQDLYDILTGRSFEKFKDYIEEHNLENLEKEILYHAVDKAVNDIKNRNKDTVKYLDLEKHYTYNHLDGYICRITVDVDMDKIAEFCKESDEEIVFE